MFKCYNNCKCTIQICNLKVFFFLFTTSFQNYQISHFSFPYTPHIFSLLLSHRLVIYYDQRRSSIMPPKGNKK